MDIVTTSMVLGGIVSAITIWLLVLNPIRKKYICPWFKRTFTIQNELKILMKNMDIFSIKVDSLEKELAPNGGTSLRDAINRIEDRQVFNEQRQKAMLSGETQGTFETDKHGKVIWINRAASRMLSLTPEEAMGYGWLNAVTTAERKTVDIEWKQSVEEKRETHICFNVSNQNFKLCSRSYKMIDEHKNIIGYFVTLELEEFAHDKLGC